MKTRKLKCIITGRVLTATADYYKKKLEKAGSEEELHRTYICKEAKDLITKGLTIENIKEQLGAEPNLLPIPQDIIDTLTKNEYGIKKSTVFTELTGFTRVETDPEVAAFLNNI